MPKPFCTSHTHTYTQHQSSTHQRATWNIQWIFQHVLYSPSTCRSAKKERERQEGGNGRGRWSQWVQWESKSEREREKPSWLRSKQLPLATAFAQSVPYWPADSPHHNPMQDNQPMRCRNGPELEGELSFLDSRFTMATEAWPWLKGTLQQHTNKPKHTASSGHRDRCSFKSAWSTADLHTNHSKHKQILRQPQKVCRYLSCT